MFGSRLGRGVSLGIVSAMMVGMLTGCPNGKPDVEVKTPQQIAADLITQAGAAIDDGRIEEAEKHIADAKEACASCDFTAIDKKLADAKAEIADAAERTKRDALIADGKALLATDPAGALAKAEQALAIDPDCVPAQQLKADSEAAIARSAEPDPKAEYAKINARIETADRAGRYTEAIRLIGDLEEWAVKGNLPSRKGDVPKFEAKDLVAQARRLVGSDSERQLQSALGILARAGQKDPANREVAGLKRQVEAKLRTIADKDRALREFNAAFAEGQRDARSNSISVLERALRALEKAITLAPDNRRRQDAQRLAKAVREKISYFGHMDKAKQAKNRGQLDVALSEVQKARTIQGSVEARNLEEEIKGAMAVGAADAAEKADPADWTEVVRQLKIADGLGIDVAARLAKAEEMAKTVELAARIEAIKAAVAADKYSTIADELADLAKRYPDNAEIEAIVKAGPSRTELDGINKAALAPYKKAMTDIRNPEVTKLPQEKIRILEAALGSVRGSVYEKKIEQAIERERTGIYSGQWRQLLATSAKMTDLGEKIAYLEGERQRFDGTSFLKQLETQITGAKNQRAAGAYNALRTNANKIPPKDIDQKIDMLEGAQGQAIYKDTRYVDMIGKDITAAKNARAASAHRALTVEIGKLRDPKQIDQKISIQQTALGQPVYEGTRYIGMIEASIKRDKDTKARKPFADLNLRAAKAQTPQAKLAVYDGNVNNAIYEGTSLKDQINRSIQAQKDAIKAGEFGKLRADTSAKNMTHDTKIQILTDAKPNFDGTRYEKQVQGMIDAAKNAKMAKAFADLRERLAKIMVPQLKIVELQGAKPRFAETTYDKQIDGMIQREKDAIAAKKYGDLMKRIPTIKDPNELIRRLEEAKQDPDIAGSRYEKILEGRITKERTTLKSKLYQNMMREMNDPKAKRDSAAKAEFLRGRKGDFTGTAFEKKIDAQIKGFEGRIEAERKAAAARAKADADAADRKRKADEARAAADARKKADVAAAKVYGDVMKALNRSPKSPADCDDNIQKLVDAKQQVAGSSYVARIDAQIKSQRAVKAKIEKAPPPR